MTEPLEHSLALEVLEKSPIGVLILEGKRIKWVNEGFAQALHVSKQELIGLKADQAEHTLFAPLFEESEQLCLTESGGETYWLKRHTIPSGENISIHFFNDITESVRLEKSCEKLKGEVQALNNHDAITGLLNKKATLLALEQQVSRSRRYGNPLSLIRLTVEAEATVEPDRLAETLRMISQGLKDKLRWADQIGMLDPMTFLIILPETLLDNAKDLAAKLVDDRTTLKAFDWKIRFGATAWQKGDDPRKLLHRLEEDLEPNSVALLS